MKKCERNTLTIDGYRDVLRYGSPRVADEALVGAKVRREDPKDGQGSCRLVDVVVGVVGRNVLTVLGPGDCRGRDTRGWAVESDRSPFHHRVLGLVVKDYRADCKQ